MMDQLTTILDEDGAAAIFDQVLKGFAYHIVGETPVSYRCYCSRERVEEALRCIDKGQLTEMAEDGKDITVSCQFCDRIYRFSPAQLQALAEAKEQP